MKVVAVARQAPRRGAAETARRLALRGTTCRRAAAGGVPLRPRAVDPPHVGHALDRANHVREVAPVAHLHAEEHRDQRRRRRASPSTRCRCSRRRRRSRSRRRRAGRADRRRAGARRRRTRPRRRAPIRRRSAARDPGAACAASRSRACGRAAPGPCGTGRRPRRRESAGSISRTGSPRPRRRAASAPTASTPTATRRGAGSSLGLARRARQRLRDDERQPLAEPDVGEDLELALRAVFLLQRFPALPGDRLRRDLERCERLRQQPLAQRAPTPSAAGP